MKKLLTGLAALLACACATAQTPAASFRPSHPVTIVVPVGAGGGTDAVARLFAPRLAELWKQPVVVENRTGAEGSIGAAHVAKSAPDGHTLLLTVSSLAINAHVFPKLPYDTLSAFAPVTPLAFPIAVMVGSPKLTVKDARGFVDAARAAPGKLTFASVETSTRLYGEILKGNEGIDIVHVPYKASSQWMTDLMSGLVDIGFSSVTSARAYLADGRLSVLGVASRARSRLVPQVPTFAEQGIRGFEDRSWYGLFAPGQTPPAVVRAIYDDAMKVLNTPDVRERLEAMGVEPGGEPPADFARRFAASYAEYGELIRRLKITAQ